MNTTHLSLSKRLFLLLAVLLACAGTFTKVTAHPAPRHTHPASHGSVGSAAHPSGRGQYASFRTLEQRSAIFASSHWLNLTDPQQCRAYAPISTSLVPDDGVMYPDTGLTLTMEPDERGLEVSHEALRKPWSGNKSPDQYIRDSADRLSKVRGDYMRYLASWRTVVGVLRADNAPYPTAPPVQREARVGFGSAYELSPGEYAYASDWPGQVFVRNRVLGQDAFYTQFVMPIPVSSLAMDRTAQMFLSPIDIRPLGPFQRDSEFERASAEGNRAAADYEALAESSNTSQLRGHYARLAAIAYHRTYHGMQRIFQMHHDRGH
jgi:hypothetical protein